MDQIPDGFTLADEHDWRAGQQYRQGKTEACDWLLTLRNWVTKADLTFASLAAPERAEKAVRRWLQKVAPGGWAVVGYERQERGAVHAHLVMDTEIDQDRAERLWNKRAGFCRIARIHSGRRSIDYALTVKHAIKELDVDVFGPGHEKGLYSTGAQLPLKLSGKKLSGKSPSEYEAEALSLSAEAGRLCSGSRRPKRNANARVDNRKSDTMVITRPQKKTDR
jgi:hypothetical protein